MGGVLALSEGLGPVAATDGEALAVAGARVGSAELAGGDPAAVARGVGVDGAAQPTTNSVPITRAMGREYGSRGPVTHRC